MPLLSLPTTGAAPALERLLARRRSIRDYTAEPLSLEHAAALLWAAAGITAPPHLRTAPSAGALYPLQVYLVAGNVIGLAPGVYRHRPEQDAIELLADGDRRRDLADAAFGQPWLAEAPLTLVFAARYARTTWKYRQRGIQYVHIEVGHAAQNALLMAVALNLGAAVVGAFDDARVAGVAELNAEETPVYLVPAGHRA